MCAKRPGGARSCQVLCGGLRGLFQAEWALPPSVPNTSPNPGEGSPDRGKSGQSLSWTKQSGAFQPCCVLRADSLLGGPPKLDGKIFYALKSSVGSCDTSKAGRKNLLRPEKLCWKLRCCRWPKGGNKVKRVLDIWIQVPLSWLPPPALAMAVPCRLCVFHTGAVRWRPALAQNLRDFSEVLHLWTVACGCWRVSEVLPWADLKKGGQKPADISPLGPPGQTVLSCIS